MDESMSNMEKEEHDSNMDRRVSRPSDKNVLDRHDDEKKGRKTIVRKYLLFEFKGVIMNSAYKMKYPQPELLESLINIWYDQNNKPDAIGIMCKFFKK